MSESAFEKAKQAVEAAKVEFKAAFENLENTRAKYHEFSDETNAALTRCHKATDRYLDAMRNYNKAFEEYK